jgi:hypothetical protein
MPHVITRKTSADEHESYIEGVCSCGWTTRPISNMHNAQITVLSNMETTHLKMQDGEQRLWIGHATEINEGYKYSASFLFWSTTKGASDAHTVAMKKACDRGMEISWDSEIRAWCTSDSTAFKADGYGVVQREHEEIVARYLR